MRSVARAFLPASFAVNARLLFGQDGRSARVLQSRRAGIPFIFVATGRNARPTATHRWAGISGGYDEPVSRYDGTARRLPLGGIFDLVLTAHS